MTVTVQSKLQSIKYNKELLKVMDTFMAQIAVIDS